MNERTTRALALGIATGGLIAAATVFLAGPARADGVIDDAEADYISRYSGVVCSVLDDYPSIPGVFGVVDGVMEDTNWDAGSAVDVVNTAVATTCPRHWPLLVAAGQFAATANGASAS